MQNRKHKTRCLQLCIKKRMNILKYTVCFVSIALVFSGSNAKAFSESSEIRDDVDSSVSNKTYDYLKEVLMKIGVDKTAGEKFVKTSTESVSSKPSDLLAKVGGIQQEFNRSSGL